MKVQDTINRRTPMQHRTAGSDLADAVRKAYEAQPELFRADVAWLSVHVESLKGYSFTIRLLPEGAE